MQRVVFLVDMNAFFISCEASRSPALRDVPAAVAGDPKNRSGIILAANYEARKYKVKTTMVIHEAKKLCPNLVLVPPDHDFYSQKSKEVMNILSRYSPLIQQNSIDEAWMDLTGSKALLGEPLEIARSIMDTILNELGLWCSVGISDNKSLAKMASEFKKPLGITELYQKDVKEKLWPLPVRDMYGIGRQTEARLLNLGISKIGDIAGCDSKLLVKIFGKYGAEMYRLANGIDNSPVEPNTFGDSKSVGRSTTLRDDITDIDYAKKVLLQLAEEVGADARRYGSKGRTVSIEIKYSDFKTITRQKSIPATFLTREIYNTGAGLLDKYWDTTRPVRLLGISLSNFEDKDLRQMSIFDTLENEQNVDRTKKEEQLEKTIDKLRQKFGDEKIKRAKTIK
ncbi:MAG: DNA polymerase IV [Bacillota bacterium]|nr:DNA polymerase IV [Bacillota bacterium]